MKASLYSKDGGRIHSLNVDRTTIGREGCDIIVQSPTVEKEHAIIEYDELEKKFVIRDLNTPHGTYVNDCQRVQNAAVRLASGDTLTFGYGGPRYEFQVHDEVLPGHYPPLHTRQVWGDSNYMTSSNNLTRLPYLPLSAPSGDPNMAYPTGSTSLPYHASATHNYMVPPTSGGYDVIPHPPGLARPVNAGSTKRARPLSAGRENQTGLALSGGWAPTGHVNSCCEDIIHQLEQKLLKMGDELSRLASFEAECYRKDGVIVSLRNEIADLKSALQIKQTDNAYGAPYSHDDEFYFRTELKEREVADRQNTQKLALLQSQISVKNVEIDRLKDHLDKLTVSDWPRNDPNASTNAIASLRSDLTKKDHQLAQMHKDIDKAHKQHSQTTTLINTLQRETAAKDNLIRRHKTEVDKYRRDIKDKDSQLSALSVKIAKQMASKEVEKESHRKDEEILALRNKLRNTESHVKEKNAIIRNHQIDLDKFRSDISEGEKKDKCLHQELQNMRVQYVERERLERNAQVDLRQMQQKFDKFRKKVTHTIFSVGVSLSTRELDDDDIIRHLRSLNEDRSNLEQRLNKFVDLEEKQGNVCRFEQDSRNMLERYIESLEKRLLRNGRRCEVLQDEISRLQGMEVSGNIQWFKEIICNILIQENLWEQEIEEALIDGGLEVGDQKKEPSQLIKKMSHKLQKKEEDIEIFKTKFESLGISHQEFTEKLKMKLEKEYQDEMSKVKSKLKKKDKEKREELEQEFMKREQRKVEEAIDIEKKVFEREFGNLAEMGKKLAEFHMESNESKNKVFTVQDKLQQLKFTLEKGKQTEIQLRKQLEEQKVLHESYLRSTEKEKEEFAKRVHEEVAVYREQAHQHSLTIVALEGKVLQFNKERKKYEQEVLYLRQNSKDTSKISPRTYTPKKTISRPSSPNKVSKKEACTQTCLQTKESHPDIMATYVGEEVHLKADVHQLEQLVLLLRREAADAKKECQEQSDVAHALKRDLAGASARLSDMAGEMNDKQKEKMEEMKDRIIKQDEDLFEQRKQLVQLSSLVEEQKNGLMAKHSQLKEQLFISERQEEEIKERGKEMVRMQNDQHVERGEHDVDVYQLEQERQKNKELNCVGMRCVGERHQEIITHQKEAITELRHHVKSLEEVKPPVPGHEAALRHIASLKHELSELRAQLVMKVEDMCKSETQLQSEARVSRELLNSASQESTVEKSAHRETREALDGSEQSYLKLLRTVSALLEIENPPGSHTLENLPQMEREKLLRERQKALETIASQFKRLRHRLDRKENLLNSYERDLTNLRDTSDLAGRKSAEAISLADNVRNQQDEIACLREALNRVRDELDQQKRLNTSLSQRKVFMMDVKDKEQSATRSHKCYDDDIQKHKEEVKKQKQAEKIKRKNYEVQCLKKELMSADRELNETAARLYAFESSKSLSSKYDHELERESVMGEE